MREGASSGGVRGPSGRGTRLRAHWEPSVRSSLVRPNQGFAPCLRAREEERENIEGAWRCLEERRVDEHDDDHAEHGPPKGAALASSPLPASLLTLLAKKVLKGHKKRKLNSDKDPIHPAFMKRGRSLPHQPPSIVARARHGA